MNQQRPHCYDSALCDHAFDRINSSRKIMNRIVRQHTELMCAGQNPKWAVVSSRVVKVNAQS